MMNKPSKRYLLYAIEMHESVIRNNDTPIIIEEHMRAIARLKERLQKEYPDDQTHREDDRDE